MEAIPRKVEAAIGIDRLAWVGAEPSLVGAAATEARSNRQQLAGRLPE